MKTRLTAAERRIVDQKVTELAGRQRGVISRSQLIAAGMPAHVVDGRIRSGAYPALHRGVYRIGPVHAPRAAEMAALLACGATATISHFSAAHLAGLLPAAGGEGVVDVTVSHHLRRRAGIRLHLSAALSPAEVAMIDGIRVTAPARTLLDLAGAAGHRELEKAAAEAFARRMATTTDVLGLLQRHPRRRGVAALRSLLGPDTAPARTRSHAEEAFLALVERGGIRRPLVNAMTLEVEVDFLWSAERFVVEIDGYAFHSSRRRFGGDRRRDSVLTANGYQVMRFTWSQITDEAETTLVLLAQGLAMARERNRRR